MSKKLTFREDLFQNALETRMTFFSMQNLPGFILLIDFEKAFDSVSFDFILTTLDVFNFGEVFIKWIKIILGVNEDAGFTAVTIINGNISKPLKIGRGCRQGDPIAGYLFILTIEILALLLKNSKTKSLQKQEK